jgi:hypothetical protein
LLDTGLFKYPTLYLYVPASQQVEGAAAVVFLGGGAGLVPHNLGADTGWRFCPFAKRTE